MWKEILERASSTNDWPDRSIVVLGGRGSGKSTLMSKLAGVSGAAAAAARGVAMSYQYLDVVPEYASTEVVSRIHAWTLDGDADLSPLLRGVLTNSELGPFARTEWAGSPLAHGRPLPGLAVVIVLDLSDPWGLVESLRRWLQLARKLVADSAALACDDADRWMEEHRGQTALLWQTFEESGDAETPASPSLSEESAATTPTARRRRRPTTRSVHDASSTSSARGLASSFADETLSEGLAVPVVVVVNKADTMAALERDARLGDDALEYVQVALRRECLRAGAALLFLSTNDGTNVDLLGDYLRGLLYGVECRSQAVLSRRNLFLPFGWDSRAKIDLAFEAQSFCRDRDCPFEEALERPPEASGRGQGLPVPRMDAQPKDEQEFLEQLLQDGGAVARVALDEASPLVGTPMAASLPSTPIAAAAAASPAGTTTPSSRASAPGSQNAGLTQFFQSLMKGNTSKRKEGSAAASPADPAHRS